MKKLIISPMEIAIATPPFPYIYFCEEAWNKWFTNKLILAGFDLTKEFKQIEFKAVDGVIFTQDE